jgi:hypothetical protein
MQEMPQPCGTSCADTEQQALQCLHHLTTMDDASCSHQAITTTPSAALQNIAENVLKIVLQSTFLRFLRFQLTFHQ